jgi:hypothetical protein
MKGRGEFDALVTVVKVAIKLGSKFYRLVACFFFFEEGC